MSTTIETTPRLDEEQRERFARLADVLIPGGAGLPSATKVDTHRKWLDRTLKARPDVFDVVAAVTARPGDPEKVLRALEAEDATLFESFTFVVSGAYLMSAPVRRLLGYPGPKPLPKPPLPDEADVYLEDGILDAVVARGPIYRPTPGND